jgi:hypothetical protein
MATIKLQPSGAVVIKDGKVSCACCETECCPYPADLLGVTYQAEDLPDEVNIIAFAGIYPRTGSGYGDGLLTVVNGLWTLTFDGYSYSYSECLLAGGVWPQDGSELAGLDVLVEDTFSNCYEVTWSDDGNGNGPGSVILYRVSLCDWDSEDGWNLSLGVDLPFGANGIFALQSQSSGEFYKTSSSPTGVWVQDDFYDLEINAIACP